MVIGLKDIFKLVGIIIVCACAVFVCTMFINYDIDLHAVEHLVSEAARPLYDAQLSTCLVVCLVSGGCLFLTSVVMLVFYIGNYVNSHGNILGILKAMGYSDIKIALHFAVFGLSVFAGCALGYALAFTVIPSYYSANANSELLPEVAINFHAETLVCLVILPALVFGALAVLMAYFKLKRPVLDLIRGSKKEKKKNSRDGEGFSFKRQLRRSAVSGNKILVFFIVFSAFCFSAMTQMAVSMRDLASEMMGAIIMIIGLVLAFTTLFMAVTTVINSNAKTVAMMKVFGYTDGECYNLLLAVYRPFAYLGFAVGSVYQWGLLKLMVTVVFAGIDNVPEYNFDFAVFGITLACFVAVYELIMLSYTYKIKKTPVKTVMTEQ